MATGELRARLSEMFTCMICYDDFRMKTPRMLSCLHVFCEDCIQHLLGRGQDTDDVTVSCPMCMAKTAVPSGQAANLPLFFHMRKIGDMTKEMEQCHLVCTMCKTSTNTSAVSAFCVQCAIGLCEKCHVRHNTALESHSAISVTPSTMNQLICHKHEKCVQYYCLSCQRSICCVCYLVEHREHKPVFELAYEGHVPNCDVKQCLDDRLQLADQSMQDLDHIQKDVDVITNDSRKELKRRRDSLIRQIDEQYNRFCKQVDRTHQTITEDIQEARSQVQLDKE